MINHIISECSKLARKEYNTRHDWVGKVIHWEMCEWFKFDHTAWLYRHNAESVLEHEIHKILRDFEIQTDHLILVRKADLVLVDKKIERNCRIVDFTVPTNHREKINENEKRDKYLDLAREIKKKLWNKKVTVIPIIIGALGTIPKTLVKGLEELKIGGWAETIKTTALLESARIPRRVLETWKDLLSLRLQWKSISSGEWEKHAKSRIIIIRLLTGVIQNIQNSSNTKKQVGHLVRDNLRQNVYKA